MSRMVPREINWQAVVARAKALDPDAFDLLVDEYAPRLRGFLRRMVHGSDLDDMVQEVFLRVVRTIGQYEESGRFDAWLFQIARNLARDRHRGQVRKGGQESDLIEQDGVVHGGADVGHDMERAESFREIEAAMQRLPDAERDVILLRHFGKLTFEEIAELTDTPLGTALARCHRGLSKLRQWVEEPA